MILAINFPKMFMIKIEKFCYSLCRLDKIRETIFMILCVRDVYGSPVTALASNFVITPCGALDFFVYGCGKFSTAIGISALHE
jgi:hypothetical protein